MKTTSCETFIASSNINDQVATKAGGNQGYIAGGTDSNLNGKTRKNVMSWY